jgi:hypothetical protein
VGASRAPLNAPVTASASLAGPKSAFSGTQLCTPAGVHNGSMQRWSMAAWLENKWVDVARTGAWACMARHACSSSHATHAQMDHPNGVDTTHLPLATWSPTRLSLLPLQGRDRRARRPRPGVVAVGRQGTHPSMDAVDQVGEGVCVLGGEMVVYVRGVCRSGARCQRHQPLWWQPPSVAEHTRARPPYCVAWASPRPACAHAGARDGPAAVALDALHKSVWPRLGVLVARAQPAADQGAEDPLGVGAGLDVAAGWVFWWRSSLIEGGDWWPLLVGAAVGTPAGPDQPARPPYARPGVEIANRGQIRFVKKSAKIINITLTISYEVRPSGGHGLAHCVRVTHTLLHNP